MHRPRFDELLTDPPLSPDEWCDLQPCIEVAGVVVSQPASSLLVLAVSVATLGIAAQTWLGRGAHASRRWWALSLALGGIGALCAGTSFQAFGYELKCAGRTVCAWTSWFEIAYNVLTVAAVGSALMALSHQFTSCISAMRNWAWIGLATFTAATAFGATEPVRFLLSFEFLVLAILPAFALVLFAAGRASSPFAGEIFRSVGLMAAAGLIHWLYGLTNWADTLWANGWWVSSNDVFHLCMGIWLVHLGRHVLPLTEDALA